MKHYTAEAKDLDFDGVERIGMVDGKAFTFGPDGKMIPPLPNDGKWHEFFFSNAPVDVTDRISRLLLSGQSLPWHLHIVAWWRKWRTGSAFKSMH